MEKDIIYNKDERLSKNFQLGEFIESDTAKRKGIDNTPNEEIIENIRLLVTSLLQPIRDRISYPFHIIYTAGSGIVIDLYTLRDKFITCVVV